MLYRFKRLVARVVVSNVVLCREYLDCVYLAHFLHRDVVVYAYAFNFFAKYGDADNIVRIAGDDVNRVALYSEIARDKRQVISLIACFNKVVDERLAIDNHSLGN